MRTRRGQHVLSLGHNGLSKASFGVSSPRNWGGLSVANSAARLSCDLRLGFRRQSAGLRVRKMASRCFGHQIVEEPGKKGAEPQGQLDFFKAGAGNCGSRSKNWVSPRPLLRAGLTSGNWRSRIAAPKHHRNRTPCESKSRRSAAANFRSSSRRLGW